MSWKEEQDLLPAIIEKVEKNPGIYKILLNDERTEIPRFLANDKKKILSIGQAENLQVRLKRFFYAVKNGNGHSEGKLLYIIQKMKGENFSLKFTYDECDVQFLDIKEAKEIHEYICKYGEVPVLNSAIPGRNEWINYIKIQDRCS